MSEMIEENNNDVKITSESYDDHETDYPERTKRSRERGPDKKPRTYRASSMNNLVQFSQRPEEFTKYLKDEKGINITGDSMKGKSGHEDKGKKDHEGGCPHFKMVKKMIPQIELLENGVSLVDRSMKIKMSLGNSELTMPIVADDNLPGRYTVVFVPTVAGKYGVEVYGTIHGSPVNMMIELDRVFDKNQVTQFP